MEQATRFEFVINLRTADQIGLTIPPDLLTRADKVIRRSVTASSDETASLFLICCRFTSRAKVVSLMEKTLQVLNDLVRDGVLSRYAIGGAMGATFYAEPVLTFDLDIFVILPQTGSGLLTLEPLYDTLRARGYTEEGECVNIEGIPVQFLPAHNDLLVEALTEAREVFYEQTPTRVLRAEHLVAVALQTGRDKDRERVRLLREQAGLDRDYLANVLARHRLEGK